MATDSTTAEGRLVQLGIKLPSPPEPFGTYAEAVQTGNLLFLTGMLPTEGRAAKFIGRLGAELDLEAVRKAAHLAALNALAVARQHLGSLDRVTRVVRLGVSIATSGDVRDQPQVADGASELLQDVFGKDKNPCRMVYGVSSLPLGTPVELEVIFEVADAFEAANAAHASAKFVFPANFHTQQIQTDGATIHVRVGGQGPAVVLLHGFGNTGDLWAPMAAELARDHRVVVPDLRGMGLSSHPADGYDKKTQATDIRSILTHLGIDRAAVVGHDIGATVAYAYAARYPDKTDRLVVMDAPVPGIPPWDEIVRSPALWHFSFGGPDAERLVAGRERIYLDRFWNEFAGEPWKIDEATRDHYTTLYAQPGAMRSAFAQFLSIPKDAEDNRVSMRTKLTMPVLAIGAAEAFGANVAIFMRNAADDVTEVLIANSGHWLMEEQPTATIAAVRSFLDRKAATQSH